MLCAWLRRSYTNVIRSIFTHASLRWKNAIV
jgi:hypothetical protein